MRASFRPSSRPGGSLGLRFALFTALVAAVTAALLGGYLISAARARLSAQALRDQLALARSLASHMGQELTQASQAVSGLADQGQTAGLWGPQMDADLTLVSRHVRLLDALAVLDRRGRLTAHGRPWRPDLLPPPSFCLAGLAAKPGPSGAPASGAGPGVLTDRYAAPDGEQVLCLRAPILRRGRLIGVAVGVLRLSGPSVESLSELRLGETGHAYLVSEKGEPLPPPPGPGAEEELREHAHLRPLLKAREGAREFRSDGGKPVLAAWAHLPLPGWAVVVRRSQDEILDPAARLLRPAALFMVLAVLAAAAGALWLAQRAAAPMRQLIHRVNRVDAPRGSDPEAGPGADPGDSVERLSQALDAMTRRLRLRRRQRDAAQRRALDAERRLAEGARLALLGELAAGLAHELNNPLTVIQGAAQVLAASPPRDLPRWSGEILRETGRCRRLVTDLLDLARPTPLKPEPVSLAALCRESWQQARLRERPRVRLDLPERDLRVEADPLRLKQVLTNLLRNALELRPRTPWISLAWIRRGRWIRFEVADQGPGPGPDPEALFRPFYTTKARGTGLGLSIARGLMRAHGGRLWAERAPGGGARFVAEWPGAPRPPRPPRPGRGGSAALGRQA